MSAALPCYAGAFAGGRAVKKRTTEEVDDPQAEEDAEHGGSQSITEGDSWSMSQQPLPSQSHVHL